MVKIMNWRIIMNSPLTVKNDVIRSIRNKDDISQIVQKYKLFLESVLNRDIAYIDKSLRDRIVNYFLDFIKKMIEKGYFNQDNIYDCLERLITGTSYFGEGHIDYANFQGNIVRFNFNSQYAKENMKHLLFHELVHASIYGFKCSGGFYKETMPANSNKFRVMHASPETIITLNMINHFINEIIAEATACDLLTDYSNRTTVLQGVSNFTSDWITPYNRLYQQLGYEFLTTIFPYSENQNDRQLFKLLTLKTLNFNNDIGQEIQEAYMKKNPDTWKDDLHEITTILGDLATKHSITVEKVNRVRELMKKYNQRFTVIRKTLPRNK